ncbi:MAG: UDP-N-acetylmuramate dehydrogenase [Candidatus Omnitrophica bacterium]|nr:UDP-N-acetylmuramate dehydrogenase [Candidatus Omnitrophota bacterium]MBU2044842.1 UDP-N-acetylmuramate dehydrogenase [Candidatus Omnitrophota bacterium]MBU2251159.1 UDP-N-acetylmuramate dehydrogenase [Candidatus Omnitrophota bacterium]MBU2473643.1 UDP-N-acetylmuramate dehydrogenase [Candidatus Omnitrophota bacterium]
MSLKKIELETNIELKACTTIKIGGKAKFFFLVNNPEELSEVLSEFGSAGYILGRGSNLLVSDSVIEKPVIKLGQGFDYVQNKDGRLVVGAATTLSSLIKYCVKYNLGGLENLAGIPATVGGLVAINASSYGRQISSLIGEIGLSDRWGNIQVLKRKDLVFGYRSSSIGERIVLWASLILPESSEMKESLRGFLAKRLQSQDFSYPSCGCIFKNPEKNSAGFLIDSCSLKGLSKGGARVSSKHANFIVNIGAAKYSEVDYLIKKIKDVVYKKHSIILEEEIIRWV